LIRSPWGASNRDAQEQLHRSRVRSAGDGDEGERAVGGWRLAAEETGGQAQRRTVWACFYIKKKIEPLQLHIDIGPSVGCIWAQRPCCLDAWAAIPFWALKTLDLEDAQDGGC